MRILFLLPLFSLLACHSRQEAYDATGSFEANEVIVSAEQGGRLLSFTVNEGAPLQKDQVVGTIDSRDVSLQKEQVEASIRSLSQKTADLRPQIRLLQDQLAVQQSQLAHTLQEKERTERLLKADAATGKQLDDINAQADQLRLQMAVTRQQIAVQQSSTGTQNRSVLSEKAPLQKQVARLDEQLSRSRIVNPLRGTVLTKYAEEGEITAYGKALYKIADLSHLTLRAYVSGAQLPQIRLGQSVTVLTDSGAKAYRNYKGMVTWISDRAEFTPKSIQTKDERANLVYAVKIDVPNDGYLKIGMYAEVKF